MGEVIQLPRRSAEAEPESLEEEHSPEQRDQLQSAAMGAEHVLESALRNGQPRSSTVETSEGRRGYVESPIPGGHVDAMFRGVGPEAALDSVNIHVDQSEEDPGFSVGVKFRPGGRVEFFMDGQQMSPETMPAIVRFVDYIREVQDSQAEADVATSQEYGEKPIDQQTAQEDGEVDVSGAVEQLPVDPADDFEVFGEKPGDGDLPYSDERRAAA